MKHGKSSGTNVCQIKCRLFVILVQVHCKIIIKFYNKNKIVVVLYYIPFNPRLKRNVHYRLAIICAFVFAIIVAALPHKFLVLKKGR